MSDLISRDVIRKEISMILADMLISGFRNESFNFDDFNRKIQNCINAQPMAYDVSKVIRQVREQDDTCTGCKHKECGWCSIGERIEIIRRGGIDDK